jgi:phage shock protein C
LKSQERRDEWSMVIAIALIAVGALLLLGRLGPISRVVNEIAKFAWPLALIGLGLLLYFSARAGSQAGGSARRLYRSRDQRMVAGVLGGLASYFGINPTPVRVLFVVFVLLTGVMPGVLLYVIAMFLVPEESSDAASVAGAYVPTPPAPSGGGEWSGWPHGGTETVQVPAPDVPPPPAPAPPDAGSEDTTAGGEA